jgi:hypothetical protein
MTDTYDSPWKEMLDGYFADFMAFFFPEAHADIDWTRGYESLDQELQQIVRDAALGRRLADKLMQVWRRNGETQMVLVHTEIQGERDADFPKRMYTYNYRLFDRYDRPVVSLAILGDDSPGWRPDTYRQSLWGCQIGFQFPVIKLHDYRGQEALLEASANPFAIVVLAHLQTRATRTAPEARLHGKMRLVRHLYGRGYQREDVLELFRFIDWVMALPAELERRFRDELTRLEAEIHMPYITSIERMGIEKGIQQGIEQGIQQGIHQGEMLVLRRQLTRRFGPLPAWAEQRLEEASVALLEAWAERVLDAARLEEVFETP